MTPPLVKRYPANSITPHGAYWFLSGKKPNMNYRSYDGTSVFNLMGGLAIPDPVNSPECIRLKSLSGLIAPWQPIEQKGATQDGVTFVDALYDPIDGDMEVEAAGKTPERTAQLIRDWIAAWDARKPGQLSFFDQRGGYWWAPVRWTRNPVDKIMGGKFTRQTFTWPFKSEDAFWRTFDDADEFRIGDFSFEDEFEDLSAYTLAYSGSGDGTVVAGRQRTGLLATIFGAGEWEAKWQLGSNGDDRTVVARRTGFTTATDSQIAYITLGTSPDWTPWDTVADDIWVRLKNTGTAGETGVRLRIQRHLVKLSYFVDGVETLMRSRPMPIPPVPGEQWALAVDNNRTFKIYRGMRGLAEVMTVVEGGAGSAKGSTVRGMGWGMKSGEGLVVEFPPGAIRRMAGGDNTASTQTGMLRRINVGDQPMWDRYTLTGPGTFYIASGPGSTDMVKYGPLEAGQMVQLRSDPRKRGVVDLTSVQPTPQQQKKWQEALDDFISFAAGNNAPPLLEKILSRFGVQPPQGNLYSLLDGRFAKPIPPRPAAGPMQAYNVLVQVEGGDSNTRIVATGTPLRRWPM